MRTIAIGCIVYSLLLGVSAKVPQDDAYDVVVYDASSGGVMAAVSAARHGASQYPFPSLPPLAPPIPPFSIYKLTSTHTVTTPHVQKRCSSAHRGRLVSILAVVVLAG